MKNPAVRQHNTANTSDLDTPFLDLNIQIICNNINTSVYDKRQDFWYRIVSFS